MFGKLKKHSGTARLLEAQIHSFSKVTFELDWTMREKDTTCIQYTITPITR
jgi:hypothetical protein